MTMSFDVTVRNAALNAIRDQIDLGAGPGKIRVYSGVRPANGAPVTSQVLLSEHAFSDPSAPTAVNSVLTFSAIASDTAVGTGVATWARVLRSDNTFVADGRAGSLLSSADFRVNNVNVEAGATVNVLSGVIRMSA